MKYVHYLPVFLFIFLSCGFLYGTKPDLQDIYETFVRVKNNNASQEEFEQKAYIFFNERINQRKQEIKRMEEIEQKNNVPRGIYRPSMQNLYLNDNPAIQAQDMFTTLVPNENLLEYMNQQEKKGQFFPELLFNILKNHRTNPAFARFLNASSASVFYIRTGKDLLIMKQASSINKFDLILQHEFTHLEQNANEKVLNSIKHETEEQILWGDLIDKASLYYLDNLKQDPHGNMYIDLNNLNKPETDGFYSYPHRMNEAEADIEAAKRVQDPIAYLKMLEKNEILEKLGVLSHRPKEYCSSTTLLGLHQKWLQENHPRLFGLHQKWLQENPFSIIQ